MDPRQALLDCLRAFLDGDLEEAHALLDGYRQWAEHAGFVPPNATYAAIVLGWAMRAAENPFGRTPRCCGRCFRSLPEEDEYGEANYCDTCPPVLFPGGNTLEVCTRCCPGHEDAEQQVPLFDA